MTTNSSAGTGNTSGGTPPYAIGEAVSALRISGLGRGRVSAVSPRADGRWDVTVILHNVTGKPTSMDYTVSARGRSDYMDHGANSPEMFANDRPRLPELAELLAALRV